MNRLARTSAGAVAACALLAACSAPLPVPEPDAVPAALPPAVSTTQVEDVLGEVSAVLAEADAATQLELLTPRVTGPAMTVRNAEYVLTQAGDTTAITPVPAAAQTVIAPTTDAWPRTLMVVTEPPADLQPPLLLTFVQNSPREQYQLWSWSRLFPGAQMPATAQPEVGSALLPVDADTLAVPPADVLARYADVLTNGAASPHVAEFAEDPLTTGIRSTREAYGGLVGENGTLAETYQPTGGGPYAVQTADGGAIVVGAIQTVTTITLADSTLKIGDQTAGLLGKDTVASNLGITWISMVAFAVPPAGSTEPIRMIGAEHSRVQVTGE
ncbi:hypothetical protein [Actinotalea subterranea]|uniref:hypothetical protein n=1 Tax=Actinotalea subterranea TaxID=2607497 RepID=UPI0011EF4423|nr:hypothetical protein [Actinotalea subterranea]